MTRINSSIRAQQLTDEHLLAEHREIKRLPGVYKKRIESGKGLENLPNEFTLGTGHVLFFINKGTFTLSRYIELHQECLRRGFNVEDYRKNWLVYGVYNGYEPTEKEHQLLVERITDRIMNSPKKEWHYYGKPILKKEAVQLLNLKE